MAKITEKTVAYVADLIKLFIPGNKLGDFRDDLETALDPADLLAELDTRGVSETARTISASNVFREDVTQPGLSQDEALSNGHQTDKGYFVVKNYFQNDN